MTQREIDIIAQQIARANNLVASWPEWKQNILAHSSIPTLLVPRTPIANQPQSSNTPTAIINRVEVTGH